MKYKCKLCFREFDWEPLNNHFYNYHRIKEVATVADLYWQWDEIEDKKIDI